MYLCNNPMMMSLKVFKGVQHSNHVIDWIHVLARAVFFFGFENVARLWSMFKQYFSWYKIADGVDESPLKEYPLMGNKYKIHIQFIKSHSKVYRMFGLVLDCLDRHTVTKTSLFKTIYGGYIIVDNLRCKYFKGFLLDKPFEHIVIHLYLQC